MRDLDALVTERSRPDLADLDRWSTRELVELMNREDATVPAAVATAAGSLTAAIEAIVPRMRAGGRLIHVGAGTPGRLAILDAAECVPTFGVAPGRVVGLIAGGEAALTRAVERSEDDRDAAVRDLDALDPVPNDTVVGLTASGRTPYVLAAVQHARELGCLTVGVAANPDAELSRHVDHPLEIVTGPEIVAGSTRLKAGTAQKLVLNALSTVTMIRLGKTFGNLMVDVQATNAKLEHRARRIVEEATGVDASTATETLEAAGGAVKTAIVALLADVGTDRAAAAVRDADGVVRAALRDLGWSA